VRGDFADAKLNIPTTGEPIKMVKNDIRALSICINVPDLVCVLDLAY
jgi:hypothetical protein